MHTIRCFKKHFSLTLSFYVISWRRKAAPSEILVTKNIYSPVTEISLTSFVPHFSLKLIRSFLGIRSLLPKLNYDCYDRSIICLWSWALPLPAFVWKKPLCAFPHLNSDLGGVDLVFLPWLSAKGSCVRISGTYFFLYAAC